MLTDDFIYAALLLISLVLGPAVKAAGSPVRRQLLSTLFGVLFIIIVCRQDAWHFVFSSTINTLVVILVPPRLCHRVSFVWSFGYIVFFRTTHYFGLPPVRSHSNAVQLLLTLKMVGLAYEIHDSWKWSEELAKSPSDRNLTLANKYLSISPSVLDIFSYCFCYIGLLTGPYYRYRLYHDMLHDSHTIHISMYEPVKNRLIHIIPTALVYFIFSSQFSIQHVRSDAFYSDYGIWYRVSYMVAMFIIFRTRLYVAWIAAECMCMTAALGIYPTCSKPRCGSGPTDLQALDDWNKRYDKKEKGGDEESRVVSAVEAMVSDEYSFEAIHNIDIYGCELATTVREGMRSWNQTVQYWLASFVYRRIPYKNGPLRVAVTMMVSAFWHGVHPGYYLSFITIPLNLVAEDTMIGAARRHNNQRLFDWLCWFCKMRSFDYMCMAFLLLNLHDTLRYWSSIYYIGHVAMVLFIILGHILRKFCIFGRKEHVVSQENEKKLPQGAKVLLGAEGDKKVD